MQQEQTTHECRPYVNRMSLHFQKYFVTAQVLVVRQVSDITAILQASMSMVSFVDISETAISNCGQMQQRIQQVVLLTRQKKLAKRRFL